MAKKKAQATGEEKPERSGRVSLYLSPELHTELAFIADTLGLDINGLLRLMIARTINHYRTEALLLAEQMQENLNLLQVWKEQHPGRPIREFWDDYWRYWHAKGQKQMLEALGGFNFEKAEEMAARAATKGTVLGTLSAEERTSHE
jgi:hypothetical protein